MQSSSEPPMQMGPDDTCRKSADVSQQQVHADNQPSLDARRTEDVITQAMEGVAITVGGILEKLKLRLVFQETNHPQTQVMIQTLRVVTARMTPSAYSTAPPPAIRVAEWYSNHTEPGMRTPMQDYRHLQERKHGRCGLKDLRMLLPDITGTTIGS